MIAHSVCLIRYTTFGAIELAYPVTPHKRAACLKDKTQSDMTKDVLINQTPQAFPLSDKSLGYCCTIVMRVVEVLDDRFARL